MTHMEKTVATYIVYKRKAEKLLEAAPKELVTGKQKGRYMEMLQEARQYNQRADEALLELEQQLAAEKEL